MNRTIKTKFHGLPFLASILLALWVTAPALDAQTTPRGPRLRSLGDTNGLWIGSVVGNDFSTMPAAYTNTAKAEYKLFSPENAMKMRYTDWTQGHPDYGDATNFFNFTQWANAGVLADVLVYYIPQALPDWVNTNSWTSNSLYGVMSNHIMSLAGYPLWKGKIQAWEVVNEAFNTPGSNSPTWTNSLHKLSWYNDVWLTNIGPTYIEQAFKLARTADTNALLLYNDHTIEEVNYKSTAIYNMVKDFQSRGIPIDAIGFQFHEAITSIPVYASVATNLDRFQRLGLKLYVSELDIATTNVPISKFDTEARVYYNIADVCLRCPAITNFQTWGFTDAHSWLGTTNYPLPFDTNYNAKPAYYAIQDALSSEVRPQILVNNGFENGTNSWIGQMGASIVAVTGGAHSGTQSVRAFNRTTGSAGPAQSVTTAITNIFTHGAGRYYLSGWLKTSSGSGTGKLTLRVVDGLNTRYLGVSGPISTNWSKVGGWINLFWYTNVTDATLYAETVESALNTVDLYADDLTLGDGNLLGNGTFEAGTANWYGNSSATITASTNELQHHYGSEGVTCTGRSFSYQGPAQDILTNLLANGPGNYDLQAYLKLASGTGTGQITVRLTYGGVDYRYSVSNNISSSTWTNVAGTVGLNWNNTLTDAVVYLETPGSTTDFYSDDVWMRFDSGLPPDAPTGFAAVGLTYRVSLSWDAIDGVTGYNIYRAMSSGGPYTNFMTVTTNSYVDSPLAQGTVYYYYVTALDYIGQSTASATNSALTIPAIPTGLTATGGVHQVVLNWPSVLGATNYNVSRSTNSGSGFSSIALPATPTFTDSTAADGTTYYYEVSAGNSSGWSGFSTQANALTVPAVPVGLAATGGSGQVSLHWNASASASSYNVKRSLTSGGTYTIVTGGNTSSTNFTDTTVASGTTYFYEVSALDATGESANSSNVSAMTIPAVPSGLTATSGEGQVLLSWSTVTGASQYNVLRSTNAVSGFASIGTPTAPPFTDPNATNGTTFYYEVSAGDSGGWSADSTPASTTPPLTGIDIGSPAVAGSFSAFNGSYTVNGGGTNVYLSADQFYFAYQVWTGDVAVVTRVTNVQNTSIYAKSGIMIRESLTAGSSHATADITPGFGIEFIRRYATGTNSTNTVTSGLAAPYWVKLVRSLNTITAYQSADGSNWELIGSDTVTMAPTVYVGLMVCAQTNNQTCTANFDNFSVSDPWISEDIGSPSPAGSANVNPATGSFTVWGAGTNIYGVSDQFQYVYQPMYTNGQVVVKVLSFQSSQPVAAWAKGGVMIREALTAGSAHAMVDLTGSNGVEFNYRTNSGATTIHTVTNGPVAPYWVKLVRSNSTNFTSSYSPDGTNWTTVGSGSITNAAMNVNPVYIGLITCSATNGVLCTNVFNNVTITPGP